jgi:coenzyme F420-0:L-glutamate ligase / coenzyme F420-1:gamma-L-glutamate ligase
MAASLTLSALPDIPLVEPGDDLVRLILAGVERLGEGLLEGDVLVVCQKIVSKAEGRYVDLASVVPSEPALALALETDKDPRLVELILSESAEVLRKRPGLIVVEHRLGFVLANAGIDQSNVPRADGRERVLLLPIDPDASAARMRAEIRERCATEVGVLIIDTIGRAWRSGVVGIAIGAAGVAALDDLRGKPDLFGRRLEVTMVAHADELAAAASMLMGQADEGRPVVLVRGLPRRTSAREQNAQTLIRARDKDLFR